MREGGRKKGLERKRVRVRKKRNREVERKTCKIKIDIHYTLYNVSTIYNVGITSVAYEPTDTMYMFMSMLTVPVAGKLF